MKYIVLGLGNFGTALATRPTKLGHEVIGVDSSLTKVEGLKGSITHTVAMDSTDRNAVASLPLKDSHAVIVAIGEDEGASLITTALLKQMNVPRIIGRVVSDLQLTVLRAMGVEEYLEPETDSAERLAARLDNADIVDSFKISDKYSIIETRVPDRYVGKTLSETNFTNEYGVIVLTTIRKLNDASGARTSISDKQVEVTGIAKSSTRLHESDILVLFGETRDIDRLIRKNN